MFQISPTSDKSTVAAPRILNEYLCDICSTGYIFDFAVHFTIGKWSNQYHKIIEQPTYQLTFEQKQEQTFLIKKINK